MNKEFHTIGIVGRHRVNQQEISNIIEQIYYYLLKNGYKILLESETAQGMASFSGLFLNESNLQQCDLLIVVGGDGGLLHAAQQAIPYNIPLLGVNKGKLGFLTDIHPQYFESELDKVLNGQFITEERFLLTAAIQSTENDTALSWEHLALNDVVLLPGELTAHMIEFSIHINDELVCSQRADGLIITTPTGSTAYALSGGGPILHPNLDAVALVPMFPHTLSNRPIVIRSDNLIKVHIDTNNESNPRISFDGQKLIHMTPGQNILIRKHFQKLTLIHPLNYNYYERLRTKLGWQSKH